MNSNDCVEDPAEPIHSTRFSGAYSFAFFATADVARLEPIPLYTLYIQKSLACLLTCQAYIQKKKRLDAENALHVCCEGRESN